MSPPRYRSLLDLARAQSTWKCHVCARTTLPSALVFRRSFHTTKAIRINSADAASIRQQQQEQLRRESRKKNMNQLYYSISIVFTTLALAYAAVPLYKTICQQTGWGGQPIQSSVHGGNLDGSEESIAAKLTPVTSSRRLRVTFAGSTSDILPWKFTPQQREVRVLPGETALAFYTATNLSKDEDIIGVATYSVTPGQVAPYFSKIQCFCFEEQRLNRGETVDMPVFFYIDPDFLKDPNMKGIDTITLNYTFFKARYDKNGHLSPMPMPY
ncbi:hypothetical protein M433DRAFT_58977 [Acidomyces richmondensis BFW]|nr:MAG: hypothetical protein FE78DRAFT_153353 [Acidomyces sp. 'richmondensis']KYG49531.1 hypothetical protein M433DRAFT_58977 [Acidomyces richmondensis BFW]